jgi:CHAT domain-containing protein
MHRSSLNHKRGKHQPTTERKCLQKNSKILQNPQNKHLPHFTKLSPHDDLINVNHSITRHFNTKPNNQISPPSTQTPHTTTRHSNHTQISNHRTDHNTVMNSDTLLNPITINIQSQFPNSNLDQSIFVHTSHLTTIPPSKLSHRCNRITDISDKAAIHTTTT